MKSTTEILRKVKWKLQTLQTSSLWLLAFLFWLNIGALNLYLLYRNELRTSYQPSYSLRDLFYLNIELLLLPIGSVVVGLFLEQFFRNNLNLGKAKYVAISFIVIDVLYSIGPISYTFQSRIRYNYCAPIIGSPHSYL